jgi:Cof subfamily protein (haloacid dehalogenase superfamily)
VIRPRLVACDLDGTLLRSDRTVSARTVDAWRAAAAADLELVVVTARPPRFFDLIGLDLFSGGAGLAVCANGALVYDPSARSVVDVRPLARAVAERIVATPFDVGPLGFAVETGSRVVAEPGFRRSFEGDPHFAAASFAELWSHGTPIVKLLAWSSTAAADEVAACFRGVLPDVAECTFSGGKGLVELSAPGVTKVSALSALCAARGILPTEVVAFGDMPNDLAMLQWAGTGYAVANAHPSVLSLGLPVTAANDDDGVAVVLERLLSGLKARNTEFRTYHLRTEAGD